MAGELTIEKNTDGTATINFPGGGSHTVGKPGANIDDSVAALKGAYGDRIGNVVSSDLSGDTQVSNASAASEAAASATFSIPEGDKKFYDEDGNLPHQIQDDLDRISSSDSIPANPDDYEISGGKGNWTITWADGTTAQTTVRNPASAANDARLLANAMKAMKSNTTDDLEQTGNYGGGEDDSNASVNLVFETAYPEEPGNLAERVYVRNSVTGNYLTNEDGSKVVGFRSNFSGSYQLQKFYTQELINSVLADSNSTVLQDAEITYFMEDGKWRARDQYGNIGARRATKDAALATYNRSFNVGMKTAETAEQKAALLNIAQDLSMFGGTMGRSLSNMVAGAIDPYLVSDHMAMARFQRSMGFGSYGGITGGGQYNFSTLNNPDNEIGFRKHKSKNYYYVEVYSPEGNRLTTLHQNFSHNPADYIEAKMRFGLTDEKLQAASQFLFDNQGNYGGGAKSMDKLVQMASMTGAELKEMFLKSAGTGANRVEGEMIDGVNTVDLDRGIGKIVSYTPYDQDYRGYAFSEKVFSPGFESTMMQQMKSRVNASLALFDVYDAYKPKQYTPEAYIAEINERLGLNGKLAVKNVGDDTNPFHTFVYTFDSGEEIRLDPTRDFIIPGMMQSEVFRYGSRSSTPYWLLAEADGDYQSYQDLKREYGITSDGASNIPGSGSGGGGDSGSGSGSSDQDQSQGGGGGSGSVDAGGSGGQIQEGDGTTKTATTFQGGYEDPVAVGNTGTTDDGSGTTQTGTVQSGQSLTNAINNPANVSVAGTYPMAQQTGTNQATTQTANLSALPAQYQYKENYTGTNMQNLTQPSQGVSGPRSVLYRNDYGQEMMITVDANGTPLIYVPPGYKPVAANNPGGLQKDPQKSSEDIYLKIAKKVMNFQGDSSDLKKAMAASPAMAAKLGSMTNALMNMGGVRLGATEGTDTDGMTAEEIAAANVDNIGNAIGAETFQNMQKDVVEQTMTGPRQGTVDYLTVDENDLISSTAGQAVNQAEMANVATADTVTQANTPISADPVGYDATQVQDDITTANQNLTGVTGTLGTQSQVDAQQQTTSSVTGLQGAEGQSVDVTGAPTRTLQTGPQGELVTGTGVDQSKVDATFGTGEVAAASMQDELAGLMQQFEGGDTPAWAAGSMRKASAMLAARGIGASSMAGQAVIQAAMEAALPIAQIDTANKQQMAMFKAEQRAKFLGMEFDQAFQAKVINAAKVSEIANMNFTAEQQVALENSRAANTMALENLRNDQAIVMAEAAALSQLDMANLNNRQQAAVQNAQNFLQMDMANLNNLQQTAMFKAQQIAQAIFTDQAADNAAKQFNAVNENQTNQFFANLSAQVSQFNASQANAMDQFNLNSTNALRQFNAEQQNQREMFNAQNGLVIAQANAQWRQNIATLNSAAQNESNMQFAQTMNGFTATNLDEIWQRERDLLSMAFKVSEGNADRATEVVLQKIAAQASKDAAELQANLEAEKNTGNFIKEIILGITGLG